MVSMIFFIIILSSNMCVVGCPKILRCDRGTENSRIAYLQPFLRRNCHDSLAGTDSFQYGRSASNQVYKMVGVL